jgi:hypothetical protein
VIRRQPDDASEEIWQRGENSMMQKCVGRGVLIVLGLLWCAPQAFAEPYVALYGGISLLADTDIKTDVTQEIEPRLLDDGTLLAGVETFRNRSFSTDVDNSAVFGGKVGYWFDFFPFVAAELDVYTFRADLIVPQGQTSGNLTLNQDFKFDTRVVAIGFNIMGRYTLLKGPDFPRGRLQPYVGIGPGLFVTNIKNKRPVAENNLGEKTLAFGGLQAILGGRFFIHKKLSLFVEYKFSHFTADLSGAGEQFSISARQNISAHHFVGGISYHFY